MASMLREIKPRNARSARALKERAPREIEGAKRVLFLKSSTCSAVVNDVSRDLHKLKKPHAVLFTKRNEGIHPFEDAASLEFFSAKNDTALLCFTSSNKKRPHALTFVRCFDGKVLDMLETTVDPGTLRTMQQFKGGRTVRAGLKPLLAFSGDGFEEGSGGPNAAKLQLAKSLLLDFFRGEEIKEIDVEGLQELISFSASEVDVGGGIEPVATVHMRVWRLVTKRSGQRVPRVELEEIGPRVDLKLRRMREADPALLKEAMKQARGSEPRTKKNIDMDALGDKTGRIHLGKQDLAQLQTRKMKGLKRGRDENGEMDGPANGAKQAEESEEDEAFDDEEEEEGDLESEDLDSDDSGEIEFLDEEENPEDDDGADGTGAPDLGTATEGGNNDPGPTAAKRRRLTG